MCFFYLNWIINLTFHLQFHERRFPVEVDGQRDIRMVLSRNDCPIPLQSIPVKDLVTFGDINDLSDDPSIQAQEAYRGDIPLVSKLDDSEYKF